MHINDLSCLFSSLWCRAQKPWDSGPQTPTLLLWGITAFMPDKTNQIKRKKCPSNPGILTAGCKRVFAFPWSDALKTAHFPIKGPMIFASCERWLMCSTLVDRPFTARRSSGQDSVSRPHVGRETFRRQEEERGPRAVTALTPSYATLQRCSLWS